MKTFFGLCIYAGLCAVGGVLVGLAWFLATGTIVMPLLMVVVAGLGVGVVCDPIAEAITRRLVRPARDRSRAHARPDDPTKAA